MHIKKYLALALSAILMLVFCTGCKGDKPALTQLLADMLESQYPYLQVEIHPELEEALVHSVKKGGTEEEILAQVVEDLELTGRIIPFEELEDGQHGDHALDTVFQAGSDYTAAARSTLNQWAPVLNSLHRNGKYIVNLAMIEENGGYHIAADVYVEKAGSSHSQNNDDEEKEDPEEDSYTREKEPDGEGRIVFTIHKPEGLQDMINDYSPAHPEILGAHIVFDDNIGNIHLTNWVPIGSANLLDPDSWFSGVFDGGAGNHFYLDSFDSSVISSNYGVFGGLYNKEIKNIDLTVTIENLTSKEDICFGGIAGMMAGGTIENCNITFPGEGLRLTSKKRDSAVGGVVGCILGGTIKNCEVNGNISSVNSERVFAGGIVALNENLGNTAAITECNASGTITAVGGKTLAIAGGIIGYSDINCTVSESHWTSQSGTIKASTGNSEINATESESGTGTYGEYGYLYCDYEISTGTLIGYDAHKKAPVGRLTSLTQSET